MQQCNFHCGHAVFGQLGETIPVDQELLDAASDFIGGTLFKGLTCSAYTAGVMVIGMKLGEIENSYLRVKLAIMISGGFFCCSQIQMPPKGRFLSGILGNT
jgi:hypothetical protein